MAHHRSLALASCVLLGALPAAATPLQVHVRNSIVDHVGVAYDDEGTRPALFGYTGETIVEADGPVTLSTDVTGPSARLRREEVFPNAAPGATMRWVVAGRGAPMRVNAQDSLPIFVVVPARSNPFATTWYQRQETATDLWHWGGVMAGSQLGATERSENAVVGIGPAVGTYPPRSADEPGGELRWQDDHLIRTATTSDQDPAGDTFTGTFAVNLATPALQVVGGDGVFTSDTQAPPLVLSLPVRPSGLTIFSNPPAPPGVSMTWTRTLDFNARTLTLRATIKAGSVWPESGADDVDPSLRAWEWRPMVVFPGWDYGPIVNDGALATLLRPASLRSGGSLEAAHELTAQGLPGLPPGLLDLNLPEGAHIETAWGDRAVLRAPLVAGDARVGVAPSEPAAASADVEQVTREGIQGLSVGDGGTHLGELYVPAVEIDGVTRLLDDALRLDTWTEFGVDRASIVSLYEVDGVFLDVLLDARTGSFPQAGYYLYDAHSEDGELHEVRWQTFFDPSIGGDDGDRFVEPFYTQTEYPIEMAVPQGVLDFPVGAVVNGWIGSVPAVEMRDDAGFVRHFQLYPNQPNTTVEAFETTGYLLADHGGFELDPASAIEDREPIVGTDIAFAVENGYRGRIWNRDLIPFQSFFWLNR
jgi:hypothetical protein